MTVNNASRRLLRQSIIGKIVASGLVGVLAFLVSQGLDANLNKDFLVGIGVSVFISGVAFITQFLMDSDRRLDAMTHEIERLTDQYSQHASVTEQLIRAEFLKINDEFTKINAATKLFGAVEASALKTDAMTQLVQHSTTITVDAPPLIINFAQAEIARLSGYLRDLGQRADLHYPGEDRDWLLGLTGAAGKSIDATSLTTVDAGGQGFVDGGLWISDLGRHYLDAQKEAIGRGVSVRRLFILDRMDLQNHQELSEVLGEQHGIGVQIRLLEPRKVPATRRMALVDFIVIDDAVVYRSSVSSPVDPTSLPNIESTRLISNPYQVRDHIGRFDELWALGQSYPPALPPAAVEDVTDPVD